MINYIGDISKEDACVLAHLAESSSFILEFGVGASTQVLSAYADNPIVSLDTSKEWIERTRINLGLLKIENSPAIFHYETIIDHLVGYPNLAFDLIFDDGVDELRREFAIHSWRSLKVGGILALHDTRRLQDIQNVCAVIENFGNEIEKVLFNYQHSNITLIYKKEYEPYENWQITEKKEPWQLGWAEIPEGVKLT
jgi:roadblock/LC7 domain-containing protein